MNEASQIQDSSSGVLITQAGYDKLHAELEYLTLVKRPEIADRIRESQQHGEFSEDNSELDEVKFEQAMVENRIADLKSIFGNATVLDEKSIPIDKVGPASLVTVTDLDFDDQFTVRLVSSIEADPNLDMISNESPMGIALAGHVVGEVVQFEAPDGAKRYRIDKIAR